MTKIEKEKLDKFLKEHNAFRKYYKNLKIYTLLPEDIEGTINLISGAFDWEFSPEGWDYWLNLNIKWYNLNKI
jgi:hypothetical protein